jgi:N-acetylglucosamine transport system permease protein
MANDVRTVAETSTDSGPNGSNGRPPRAGTGALVLAFLLPPRFSSEKVRNDRRYRTLDKYRFICWFLLVPLVLYVVFVISPFFQAIYYSMTDWTGFSSDFAFVGFDNYAKLLDDSTFWASMRHSLLLCVVAPVGTLGLGLFFAFMLQAGGRGKKNEAVSGVRGATLYKNIYFFPQVLSVAIIGVVWGAMYDPITGPINEVLRLVGLGSLAENWLANPDFALACVLFVLCWMFIGFYVVLFSAAMGAIPRDIYEAALLDGASRPATFFRVTLPLIWDTVQTGWIYMGIQALDSFAIVHIMTINRGGPGDSTLVTPVYLFKKAFDTGQAGYATAIGVVLLLVTMVFAGIMMLAGRRDRIEY